MSAAGAPLRRVRSRRRYLLIPRKHVAPLRYGAAVVVDVGSPRGRRGVLGQECNFVVEHARLPRRPAAVARPRYRRRCGVGTEIDTLCLNLLVFCCASSQSVCLWLCTN
jgi:hypothetical protein